MEKDTSTYMLRETVNSTYIDDAFEEWTVLDRFYREEFNEEWQYAQKESPIQFVPDYQIAKADRPSLQRYLNCWI